MDCIIDYESYQTLKQDYEQVVDCNRVLESENETLVSSNKILKRLLISLENIKTSLEQKVLIIQSYSSVKYTEQLVPFDRELQRLDEEYCQLKCELNRLEFAEEEDNEEEEEIEINKDFGDDVNREETTNSEPKSPPIDTIYESLDNKEMTSVGEDYSAATRLVDQLEGNEIDDNCVQYVVHQLLPNDGVDSGCDGQTNEDSTTDFVTLPINSLTNCSTGEEPTPKRGRTKKPKGFWSEK